VAPQCIQLRGVEVHNLQAIDLDIPRQQLVVVCGVSGSGKTSLALDTLYAEGQRRYIESFSAYTRQFLEQLGKPAADKIEGIPPAIAVTRKHASRSSRSTVGTSTETADYLRLLFAKIGHQYCIQCNTPVRKETAADAAARIDGLPAGQRYMIGFSRKLTDENSVEEELGRLREAGFLRLIVAGRLMHLDDGDAIEGQPAEWIVVVDRLTSGQTPQQRLRDSLETAFQYGSGQCCALVATDDDHDDPTTSIDGRTWRRMSFSSTLRCAACDIQYPQPEPRLYSFNSPLGACPNCEGFGDVLDIDMDLVVPDPSLSLREGAIACWTTKAYQHQLDALLEVAGAHDIPVDVPFHDLNDSQQRLIREGIADSDYGGLRGFFAGLEKRKYKMHVRVFLSRWRSYRRCGVCEGRRLRPEALATQVNSQSIADISLMKIDHALEFFRALSLSDWERSIADPILEQVESRLRFLQSVGLGYLTLDRTLRTLSGGEAQRVALTSALGSSLVRMLYVLDEPSVGLHPRDVERLLASIQGLRDRGNSVICVEHEEMIVRAADHVIEIGPGAGDSGGDVVYEGPVAELEACRESLTSDYLFGRRGISAPGARRQPRQGAVTIRGARGNNLQNITVEFPLGVLCVVTGVSGSGKSTLVQDTLYPALCQRKNKDGEKHLPFDDVLGTGQIDEVVMVDQSPISRSPRSNPVTYIKAFDEIRKVFADTIDARTHNYTAGHFSFNKKDGGRCTKCEGDGYIEIDMQFLADVYMQCSQCGGQRYRKEILDVRYRGVSIADVLEMSVRQAFGFFRGQTKVQTKLKMLIDVGLEYLKLGQPANTLSSGEAQRLKLAAHLAGTKRKRVLFILDEPTTGLHFADVVKLVDCFDALLGVGHSLIVVEHNLQLMRAADYVIDLGPGAADEGGVVVATGTPEEVSQCAESATASYLAAALRVPDDDDF